MHEKTFRLSSLKPRIPFNVLSMTYLFKLLYLKLVFLKLYLTFIIKLNDKKYFFKQDVYTVDDTLPWAIRQWNGCMFQVLGIIAVIMYSTPIFGAVVVPIAILYYIAQV